MQGCDTLPGILAVSRLGVPVQAQGRKKLFLSVYDDDIRMAGEKAAVARMSKDLGEVLDFEQPLPWMKTFIPGARSA